MLEGKLIGLRPLQTEDVWLLYRWFNDLRVTEDLGKRRGLFSVTMEEEKRAIEKKVASAGERDFIIVTLADGTAVGVASLLGIDHRNASAELEVTIGEVREWGKGYGKEATRMLVDYAFDVLNLHRVHLTVAEYNARAIACFAACGFQKEGVLRDDHYHGGAYRSSQLMSVLREEPDR
jgi:RimJ/RimL family protein N-acetyltransferase